MARFTSGVSSEEFDAALNGGLLFQKGQWGSASQKEALLSGVPYLENHSDSWPFVETPSNTYDVMGYTWWQVSELVPATDELLEGVITLNFGEGDIAWTPTEDELLLDTDDFTGALSNAYGAAISVCRATGEHIVTIAGTDYTINVPAVGVYFAYIQGETVPETYTVGVEYTELQKLDQRLLPDGFEDLVNGCIDAYLGEALGGEY